MTVKAKTLVKDKFWIVEEHGQKLGTLQKKDDNGWIFLSKADKRQVYVTQESLFKKFGINIFENKQTQEQTNSVNKWDRLEGEDYNVHGYPCSQKPYNPMFDVQKHLPIYTKTPKSKSVFLKSENNPEPQQRGSSTLAQPSTKFLELIPP